MRHTSVLCLPALILSPLVSTSIQRGEIETINNMALKYKEKIYDPEFNQ